MNKEITSKLWKVIQEAGDYLHDQLSSHPNHPKGRTFSFFKNSIICF